MRLFVGLGNPGGAHARNRHNVGFMALDRIAADHGFPPWRARFQGLVCEGRLGGERVMLLKPQTWMNLSGQSVGEAMRYLKLAPEDVIVFHDELDLPPGRVRLKQGGGHAGHNGLRSIHAHIGEAYGRVRIGIGHPGQKDRVAAYVLQDFARAEQGMLEALLRGISAGAPDLAAGAPERFLAAIQRELPPPRPAAAGARGAAPAAPAGRADPSAGLSDMPRPGRPEGPAEAPPPPGEGGRGGARAERQAGAPPVPPAEAPPGPEGGPPAGSPRGMLQRLAERFRR